MVSTASVPCSTCAIRQTSFGSLPHLLALSFLCQTVWLTGNRPALVHSLMLLGCRDAKWYQQRQQWWDAQRKRYRPQVWALIDQLSQYGIYTTLDFRPEMDKYAEQRVAAQDSSLRTRIAPFSRTLSMTTSSELSPTPRPFCIHRELHSKLSNRCGHRA